MEFIYGNLLAALTSFDVRLEGQLERISFELYFLASLDFGSVFSWLQFK